MDKNNNNIVNRYNDENIEIAHRPLALLHAAGCAVDAQAEVQRRLARYVAFLREWNNYASLVSRHDMDHILDLHIIDALSLAPVIVQKGLTRGSLLDIGSGGGFPAIPLAVVLPELRVILLERAAKKVAFLQKTVAALELRNVTVREGIFPQAAAEIRPDVVTARAIELPEAVIPHILEFLPEGALFFCQAPEDRVSIPDMFHVEHIQDEWTEEKLRRGSLCLVSRKNTGF